MAISSLQTPLMVNLMTQVTTTVDSLIHSKGDVACSHALVTS